MDRLDKQDLLLTSLHDMTIKHAAQHEITDPALYELVAILRGAKLLKQVAITMVSIVGSAWAFMEFVWKHVAVK